MAEPQGFGRHHPARVVIRQTDSRDPVARACLAAYYAELDQMELPGYNRSDVSLADTELMAPTGLILLVFLDGRMTGCGALLLPAPGVAEVKRMWVAPTARGLGVGRRLLEALEDRARIAGCRHVRLETRRELSQAYSLYLKCGYRETQPFHDVDWIHHWLEKPL